MKVNYHYIDAAKATTGTSYDDYRSRAETVNERSLLRIRADRDGYLNTTVIYQHPQMNGRIDGNGNSYMLFKEGTPVVVQTLANEKRHWLSMFSINLINFYFPKE